MPVTLECEEKLSMIRLDGEVGIAAAAELKDLLVQALGSSQQVRVSLLSVTELDVTAVELLWAARLEAKASSLSFAFDAPLSSMVTSALLQAGFDEFAADMDVAQPGGENPCQ